jgi:hypothetical protein
MAKLSAYGQREVARLSKEMSTPDNELSVWARMTFAFMDNGRLLTKRDVKFRSGEKHCYGWTVSKNKYKKPEERQAAIERLKAKGYTEVTP